MLQKLGYDVLVAHVFPSLNGKDIVNVSMCCKALNVTVTQLVWRSQYRSTFDMGSTNSNLEGDWDKAYAKRLNCSIYCWGGNIRPSGDSATMTLNRRGICLPWRIDSKIKTRQIALCGFGLLMLDLDGKIWLYGSLNPRGNSLHGNGDTPVCITNLTLKFDFMSVGRSRVIAVAGNKLYTYGQHQRQWKEVDVGNNILTVSAGWDTSAALRHDSGVLIWRNINQSPGNYTLIPDTNSKGALAAGAGFVLFLDEGCRLHFIDTRDETPRKQLILEKETPICIRATYIRFAVICASTRAYTGTFEDGNLNIELVEGSEEIDFSDIALGDHHMLGLSKRGEVYSWGRESCRCGSLGLGQATNLVESRIAREDGCDIVVEPPTKVQLNGAISIAAGGWQSAVIASE